ncbi:MAG: hypothetical protein A2W31_11650 [Planctomycetes bacterium RBG_16_64_10]|nr:MAG: hypothetical protein A2W31_11650 [Planctomycetes bacterium RBG_16_64_10]
MAGMLGAQGAENQRGGVVAFDFSTPCPEYPYHHVTMTLADNAVPSGKVTRVEVDGKRTRDGRFFNVALPKPVAADRPGGASGESYDGSVAGAHDFTVLAPCRWTNGSAHTVLVEITFEAGQKVTFTQRGTAPQQGGYWNLAWPRSVAITVRETAGVPRRGEPVHLALGLFADDLHNPAAEIRVVTYDPQQPDADQDGYVVAPCQVTSVCQWRDAKVLALEEKDADTGAPIRRYDPTTTVELVFLADVAPLREKVYQVLYGNPAAAAVQLPTDLKVQQHQDLGQTVETVHYRMGLATNSGAVETVTILGDGAPILLEHKLETNGAVHWNPDCYAPPIPWVHASDWERPEVRQISGPLMHRTRRYAPLPHMESVFAHVAYTFYAGQPYMISSSAMEIMEDIFVQALRNAEIVFNHAVLDEFVWKDAGGAIRSLDIESSRKHPIHALEIPADTAWMAFVNRAKKVGFASILLSYENSNRYGDPASEAQPYFYVQNGPWIYWSRVMVYPFGGANFTRMMPVRKGSIYLEKSAYLPFRLADGDDPFQLVERLHTQLTHPLHVREWMATDERTPDQWIMPLLTMPFDEGVEQSVGSQKEQGTEE